MSAELGEPNSFPCRTNKTSIDSDHYCPGFMEGTCGGEYCGDCSCGGRVTITQYLNCSCNKCGAVAAEVFEYSCNECNFYELSDHFTVKDPDSGCQYSWTRGIGCPLAELGDMEAFVKGAIAHARRL